MSVDDARTPLTSGMSPLAASPAAESFSWGTLIASMFYYRTVKIVEIRNWKLGVIHYFVMLSILAYVIGWAIIYQKGYQVQSPIIGDFNVKVKGNAWYNDSGTPQIWDSYDVVPYPAQPEALFITTNFHITANQTRSNNCEGSPLAFDEVCNATQVCPPYLNQTTNGLSTGVCDNTTSLCELIAWCPVEIDSPPSASNILNNIDTFTMFIKSTVDFTLFDLTQNNLYGTTAPVNGENLFTIEQLTQLSDFSVADMALDGGLLAVIQNWDCNLDYSIDDCKPDPLEVVRMDNPSKTYSVGYNFRYLVSYQSITPTGEQVYTRDLYKVYGLRIIFLISGQGGKFSLVPLLINVGSGLALLSIATIVSDLILCYILPMRTFYKEIKYEDHDESEVRKKKEKEEEEDYHGVSASSVGPDGDLDSEKRGSYQAV
eukprot:TRINITY_DN3718_c1_g1_i1.p1 TRINITY_DN3718_c1_g1~~TRINITY_DN3718_c1_g1_i1.p1  ORF type:complete len:457 (-),score=94.33 TRINITY_DN3718_c1_g1_i1:109-1395(-)